MKIYCKCRRSLNIPVVACDIICFGEALWCYVQNTVCMSVGFGCLISQDATYCVERGGEEEGTIYMYDLF